MSKIIGFNNGVEFCKDLFSSYGKEEGTKLANAYLDMQAETNNHWTGKAIENNKEEYTFCCELYQALQLYK